MATATQTKRFEAVREMLEAIGQDHVLKFYDELDSTGQDKLLSQIEQIDWPEVTRLIETHVKQKPRPSLPQKLEPAPWYPYEPPAEHRTRYAKARELGEDLVAQGKVAAFTVAGGQGTRLGWDAPKGTFPATPIRKLALFGCFAEYIHNVQERFGVDVPWYVMTSPANHEATVRFFEKQHHFGLAPKNIRFFPQAMMPAIGMHGELLGKVLLEDKDSLALSPNGHGGSLKALHASGALADMKRRGVEQISYTQVDNPLVRVVDPLFIGLHALDGAQMSSKMLPKTDPAEKVGVFCIGDGKLRVIEYTNLPKELAEQRLDDGSLRFSAGSIAIHAIRVDFVESLNKSDTGFALPFNRAEKKVPHVDLSTGERVEPTEPNAVKLETFVFDALPLTERSIVYETDRVEEFAPIKNADGPGVSDSPSTSRALQIERAARWLESRGAKVPRRDDGTPDATIEISQVTAIYAEDLERVEFPRQIEPGSELLL